MPSTNYYPIVHQEHLVSVLKQIFPNDQTLTNTKKQSNIKHPNTGSYLELDVWIPTHDLCFEFQDAHHYVTTWYKHMTRADIVASDSAKEEQLHLKGLTLIQVPCWWNGSLPSLIASIDFYRPDLGLAPINEEQAPIPLNALPDSFNTDEIPDVGELMLASFPVDDQFSESVGSNSWWIGEKYDGIRFSWNHVQQKSYTRYGVEISLLEPIVKYHPSAIFVDGEYWFGRQSFGLTGALIKGNIHTVHWHSFRMIAFDSPAKYLHKTPFEHRYALLVSDIPNNHPFVIIPTRVLCQGSSHLDYLVHIAMSESGEGVIMRRVKSLYQPGRSTELLKIKAGEVDQEGVVIKIEPQKYIRLKLDNGRALDVGWDRVQLQEDFVPSQEGGQDPNKLKRLAVGDVVTFSCEAYARHSMPVNAIITRVRMDYPISTSTTDLPDNPVHRDSALPMRYWSTHNMRVFLETFAKNKGLNPLLPTTWYSISESDIRKTKSGRTVLKKFYSYSSAIIQLFPDVKFDVNSFPKVTSFQNVEHRRNFFEKIARSIGFDPLIPDNWYAQSMETLASIKGFNWVLSYHKNSLPTALADLFPDIVFDKSKLMPALYGPRNRRRFFEEYAKALGFDPLEPANWYSQSKDQIMTVKGSARVLSYHGDSMSKALTELFPELKMDRKKFVVKSPWKGEQDRRAFFERFARERGFDPLVPANWYSQSVADILSIKGAKRIIAYHNHSVARALMDLFPEIGLRRDLLWQRTLWTSPDNRRAFFKQYAQSHGFDWQDPERWYLQPRDQIMAVKGAKAVIAYHSYSISKALLQLFPDIGLARDQFWATHSHS